MRILFYVSVPFIAAGVLIVAFATAAVAAQVLQLAGADGSLRIAFSVAAGMATAFLLSKQIVREVRRQEAARNSGARRPPTRVITGVVASVGLLITAATVVALPTFLKFGCRSRAAEAKTILKIIHITQQAYRGEYGTYLSLTDLTSYGGMEPRILDGARYYRFSMAASKDTFTAVATSTPSHVTPSDTKDVWVIEAPDPKPVQQSDACK